MKRPRKKKPESSNAHVYSMGEVQTSFGKAIYLRVFRDNDEPMSFMEVWWAFTSLYPGRWACQFFPPESELINEANVYHLYMLEDEPTGVNIKKPVRDAVEAAGFTGY